MNYNKICLLALLSTLSACSTATMKSFDNTISATIAASPSSTAASNNTAQKPSSVTIKQSKEITTERKSITNGRYILGGTEEMIQVETTRYRYGEESETADRWKSIAGLKYIKTGVVFDGENYWCLAKSVPNVPSVCTVNGWETVSQQLEKTKKTASSQSIPPASAKPSGSKPSETLTAEQISGVWRKKTGGTIKILSLGNQQLQIEFAGVSPTGNLGQGKGIALLNVNTATLKPENTEDACRINLNFTNNELVVTQESECGFGLNVTAAGTYQK